MKLEKGSTRSHFVENSLKKRLWTCGMSEYVDGNGSSGEVWR